MGNKLPDYATHSLDDPQAQKFGRTAILTVIFIKLLIAHHLKKSDTDMAPPESVRTSIGAPTVKDDEDVLFPLPIGADWVTISHTRDLFYGPFIKTGVLEHIESIAVDTKKHHILAALSSVIFDEDMWRDIADKRHIIGQRRYCLPPLATTNDPYEDVKASIIENTSSLIAEKRKSVPNPEILSRDKKILDLRDCLLELEIEYFRLLAENDILKQQEETDESTFIEPWYEENASTDDRVRLFTSTQRDSFAKMRQFQKDLAVKSYTSVLNGPLEATTTAANIINNPSRYRSGE